MISQSWIATYKPTVLQLLFLRLTPYFIFTDLFFYLSYRLRYLLLALTLNLSPSYEESQLICKTQLLIIFNNFFFFFLRSDLLSTAHNPLVWLTKQMCLSSSYSAQVAQRNLRYCTTEVEIMNKNNFSGWEKSFSAEKWNSTTVHPPIWVAALATESKNGRGNAECAFLLVSSLQE